MRAVPSEKMSVPHNMFEEMTAPDLTMYDPVSRCRVSFIVHRHHLTPTDS
jgi:hypothetical protein